MKWKNRFMGLILGSAVGAILIVYLIHKGTDSEEIVFGASLWLSRIYVFIICLIASITTEAVVGTSAGEVLVDVFISALVVYFSVDKETLTLSTDYMETFLNIYEPVLISVGLATFFSSPIKRTVDNVLNKEVHGE